MIRKWLAGSISAMMLLSGCGNDEETMKEHEEVDTEEVVKVEEAVEEEVVEELPYAYPVSGVGSEEEITGRAYAVMINNHTKARPQSGINKADVIYELLAEGNVTRFLAIFQSEHPERIGPVRSARDYYIELAKGYDALYVAHGYSPEAKEMLENRYVDNINGMVYDGTLFKRSKDRVAPHNSYITADAILQGAEKEGYDMEQAPDALKFLLEDEIELLSGDVANSLSVSYYNSSSFHVEYQYDEDLQKYKRFSGGELTIDADSGEPVLLDNLFIVETNHRIIDNVGRRDIDLTSGGNAYLIQKGLKREVQWENVDGKILPVSNGQAVGLVPGKTWINVIPSSPGLTESVSINEKSR
ncbi:DUF3048 domain-containing protein [Bacillus dakarensis]|uniref:DUF3048 domain-containing protein n=1 Tax=Robertmurraya dakarensis TaxID=1926278 RepID=UPI000981410D|nr:DUF3048 domain-containing protein [Bacillus dakarensis]